jgi:hypothetical protein
VIKYAILENCITLICTALIVLGLYYMSGSFHSLWGLLLFMNINHVKIGASEKQ